MAKKKKKKTAKARRAKEITPVHIAFAKNDEIQRERIKLTEAIAPELPTGDAPTVQFSTEEVAYRLGEDGSATVPRTYDPIDDAFTPGVVKITCGCSPERAARCKQVGYYEEQPVHNIAGRATRVVNKHCHVFVTEDELMDMARAVIDARFASTKREERDRAADLEKNSAQSPPV